MSAKPRQVPRGVPARPGTRTGRSDYDGDYYEHQVNGSDRIGDRVDITKLKVQSLRKYAKMYDIHGNASNASKEELLDLVRDHFATQRIEEQEVLLNLASRHQQRGM